MSYLAQQPEKSVFSDRLNFCLLKFFFKEIDIQASKIIKNKTKTQESQKTQLPMSKANKRVRNLASDYNRLHGNN